MLQKMLKNLSLRNLNIALNRHVTGNAFLMNTRQRLALLYNDHSVLENHHVALAFQLTLAQPGVNIFGRIPAAEFTAMRRAIIDMVLATDMSKHFEYLTKFQQLMVNMSVSFRLIDNLQTFSQISLISTRLGL